MAVDKNLRVPINLYKKIMYFSYHKQYKKSTKHVVPITYILEKRFFAAANFEGLLLVVFFTD